MHRVDTNARFLVDSNAFQLFKFKEILQLNVHSAGGIEVVSFHFTSPREDRGEVEL